jgi:hypothetical protein
VAAGALLGLAAGTEYVAVLPALVIGVAAMTPPRTKVATELLLGAAVPLALLALYDWACFGSPFRTGYSFITHPAFTAGQSSGFFGIGWPRLSVLLEILFGRSRGLFYVSPLVLLGIVQGVREWRRRRDPGLAVGAVVFGVLLFVNGGYYLWYGGRALGPRHLVPALGFAGVGIGYAFERLRPLAAALTGVSLALIVLGTAVGLEVPSRIDVIFDYIVPNVQSGHLARAPGASNLGLLFGLGPHASLVPVALGVIAAFAGATRLSRRAST